MATTAKRRKLPPTPPAADPPEPPVIRGCGERVAGGIYLEAGGRHKEGKPWWNFLCDPPIPINPRMLGIAARGVALLELGGVYHVLDLIGAAYYPLASDFMEEVKAHGLSRRIGGSASFHHLGPKSLWIGVHPFACATTGRAQTMFAAGPGGIETDEHGHPLWTCPTGKHNDASPAFEQGFALAKPNCLGMIWETAKPPSKTYAGPRAHLRSRPGVDYTAAYHPQPYRDGGWEPGIIFKIPIERITVVVDKHRGTHEGALRVARKADLPVGLEEL